MRAKIEDIVVNDDRLNAVEGERVASLMESIEQVGLINPLTVTEDDGRFVLRAGYHRREACIALGWKEIDVRVVAAEGLYSELVEIDENLKRGELTPAQRIKYTKRREEIIEALGLRAPPHRPKKGADSAPLQTNASLAKEVGQSKRTYKEDVSIGRGIADDVLDALASTSARVTKEDLKKVAKMQPEQQKEVAKSIASGKAKSAPEAIQQTKRAEVVAKLEDTATKEVKAIQGVYDVIVIDPPWEMKKIERDERPNQVEFDYPTMTEGELAAMQLPAADDWLVLIHAGCPPALWCKKLTMCLTMFCTR